ncbi:MAG: hypothetical protein R6W96_01685 [Clostridia bacterium]
MDEYITIYVTHDKAKSDGVVSLLSKHNYVMKLKTATQGADRDTLYEIVVKESDLQEAQKLIIENNF